MLTISNDSHHIAKLPPYEKPKQQAAQPSDLNVTYTTSTMLMACVLLILSLAIPIYNTCFLFKQERRAKQQEQQEQQEQREWQVKQQERFERSFERLFEQRERREQEEQRERRADQQEQREWRADQQERFERFFERLFEQRERRSEQRDQQFKEPVKQRFRALEQLAGHTRGNSRALVSQ
ncbi:uncharacterized protein PGTG_00309 [Puccinia graminis f. sp. tritici CRL 75-36-700-3]|uniref:Uncharacterized protein n=1 Tax=Puccinia graminis f. sp. tritici (strain CRL 75-36-700-3 / race SCCL) TaxID=418459 RepID=E3JRU3_PUCGT|nr:uncharacterized protein PGTG_00309 [Puccinia graminis f. sp. tritici CRL 75-36-700-3]EFP74353.2 hypothetical protein PGTG_00309 [Puccinia graminis f. sp. tritici CRL 75-36-700-3]